MTSKLSNNFIYAVVQYDIKQGKEWVMYAFEGLEEAERQVDKVNRECGPNSPVKYMVKAIRYFREEVLA
jgi:hypothetical protein